MTYLGVPLGASFKAKISVLRIMHVKTMRLGCFILTVIVTFACSNRVQGILFFCFVFLMQ